MGGLVAFRSLQAAELTGQPVGVGTLITISTPWNGSAAVKGGLKYLDTPVPSRIDMEPESDFIKSVLEGPVPDGLQHRLVFGFDFSMRIGLVKDKSNAASDRLEGSVR